MAKSKDLRTTAKVQKKHSIAAKARWADPVTGAKLRAALRDPANREKMREASEARWADPLMREKMIAGMRNAGERRRNRDTAES